jgi:hypothetical protein
MMLTLSIPQADALARTLDRELGDLSSEIADTDNPQFRAQLIEHRARLSEIRAQLAALAGTP